MTQHRRVLFVLAALVLPAAPVHAQAEAEAKSPALSESVAGTDTTRRDVSAFNARLGAADKLTDAQAQRLVRLLHDVQQVPWNTPQSSPDSGFIDRVPRQSRREEQGRYLASLEAELRIAEARADLLLARLPRFLTAQQVRAYAELEAVKLNRLRDGIESVRGTLGIPEEAVAVPGNSLEDGRTL